MTLAMTGFGRVSKVALLASGLASGPLAWASETIKTQPSSTVRAAEISQATSQAESLPTVTRVGGTYVVNNIEKRDDGTFQIEFKSTTPNGKYDVLKLTSDHVHVAVKAGQTLRLSAEILSNVGAVAEVAQVMLFLPGQQGPIPVWLLSNKAPGQELKASKYLEMHAPINDFVVM